MKVILRELVSSLGKPGDIIEVAPGFARNYLIPRGLAIAATFSSVKEHNHHVRQLQAKKAKLLSESEQLVVKIEKLACAFSRQVKEGEAIYGSVSVSDVEKYLRTEGFEVERRNIVLSQPIKTLGVHEVMVKTDMGHVAKLKVSVVAEESEQ